MGSYDIILKIEEIRKRIQEKDYDSAQKIMDTIPLKKVKNIADLNLLADVCIQIKEYDKAMTLLSRLYKKSKTRRVMYQMVLASIEGKNIEEAEKYLKEYEELAPNDYSIYIFRYKIDKAKKEPYHVQIESLKKLKETAYMEKWAYELAKLYYKAGMEEECIQECSDLITWFGEGRYVEKAKILRAYHLGEIDKEELLEGLKNRTLSGITADLEDSIRHVKEEETVNIKIQDTPEDMMLDELAESVGKEINSLMGDGHGEIEEDDGTGTGNEETGQEDMADDDGEKTERIESMESEEGGELEANKEYRENEEDGRINIDGNGDDEGIYDTQMPADEEESDIFRFIRTDEKNEDLDKLDKLTESLDIDIYRIFGKWLHIKDIQRQLTRSLEMILDKRTKSVQMIITGAPSSGKTTLAKDIAIFLNKTGKLKTSKIAKITAEKLNGIDITGAREKLRNCCLVVENASELKRPTIDKLLELIKYFHGDIAVIFEENKKNMNRLFRECPKLMELFKNRIHLPSYTEEDLLGFAYFYIMQREYILKQPAFEVLKAGINEIYRNTERDKQLESVAKYVQNAIDAVDLRTGKLLSALAAEGRLADAGILTILPEDFSQ
ncbi:MAG: tetratricopeptide repeat protein [Clostridiales bacterium]|nr:tetratricopeptide repeat protein [Clostridiales bacterium]